MKIAVFCSGNGSNFQAIANASKKRFFKAEIALMLCDNPDAYALRRAKSLGIKTLVIRRPDFPSKKEFEARIIKELKKEKIDLICLAGYMRILSPAFIKRYKKRIINIHPALLPSFKGAHGIKDALDYGSRVTGVTVHFVTNDVDSGPIILQKPVKINRKDTESKLAKRIHNVEHGLYPEAIRLFVEKRLKITGRKVKIFSIAATFLLVFGFESTAMFTRDVRPIPTIKTELPHCAIKEASPIIKEPCPVVKDEVVIRKKSSKIKLESCLKLGILESPFASIYDSNPEGNGGLINAATPIERPLTKEELEKMRIEYSFRTARNIAEAADSLGLVAVRDGINDLMSVARNVISLRNLMENTYNLHLRVSGEEAMIRYKKRF